MHTCTIIYPQSLTLTLTLIPTLTLTHTLIFTLTLTLTLTLTPTLPPLPSLSKLSRGALRRVSYNKQAASGTTQRMALTLGMKEKTLNVCS